jgi:hypothetical protein
MMMVMTEMAVALHLIQTIRQKGALCQPLRQRQMFFTLGPKIKDSGFMVPALQNRQR